MRQYQLKMKMSILILVKLSGFFSTLCTNQCVSFISSLKSPYLFLQ